MSNSPGSERTACQEGMSSESPEPLAGRLGARSAYGEDQELERQGETAVCFEPVHARIQYCREAPDREHVNESQHLDPAELATARS
jgi:hypothetical protein